MGPARAHIRGVLWLCLLGGLGACRVVGGFEDFEPAASSSSGGSGNGGSAGSGGTSNCGTEAAPGSHGPTMVSHTMSDGSCLWIDQTEVTRSQYDEFLGNVASVSPSSACSEAKSDPAAYQPPATCPGSVGSEPGSNENSLAECSDGFDNDDDNLVDCDDPDCSASGAAAESQCLGEADEENSLRACTDGLDNDGDQQVDCLDQDCLDQVDLCARPVTCVDWCDAEAFCAWAGKRLCADDFISAKSKDPGVEWYAVCSNNETQLYPYSGSADANVCNLDSNPKTGCGGGNCELLDAGELTACESVAGALDLLGNASEWVDGCNGAGGDAVCRVRGAGVTSSGGCDVHETQPRDRREGTIGFRCCADG